jgi:AMP-binding enzyme
VQPYAWLTYGEAHAKVASLGAALKSLGAAEGGAVGIYGVNSPEWMLAMKVRHRAASHDGARSSYGAYSPKTFHQNVLLSHCRGKTPAYPTV